MKEGTFDPRGLPSQLIGQKVPQFDLPPLGRGKGISSADLASPGRPILVNFFASWCVPCVEEAAELMKLSKQGIPIWGIAYKDAADAAQAFLKQHGDPYGRLAADAPGRVAIDWGVYGVPETYFIDKKGYVRWRWAGALTDDVVQQQVRPLLQKYG
jgi:cytochrome c biogenesis protein CcmG/thiol:disulfide interchange protein DsbE